MILIPLVNLFYPLLDNSSHGEHYLIMSIDEKIPFIKVFSVPYMLWYPFIIFCLVYFCFKDRKVYYNALISMVLGMLVCFIIYFFFQTSVPRPELTGNDILTKLVKFIYITDPPYNCFPSIHVLSSFVMMRAALDIPSTKKINMFLINCSGIIIIISTQFIKQHVILDLVFGIIIGEAIYLIADVFAERGLLWIKKRFLLWTMKKKLEI